MIKFGQGRKTAQNKHFPYHYLMMSKIVIYILCVCFDRSLQNVTFRFSSSVRASLLTFCQGRSSGHQWGLHSSLPQPGLLLPVEYFSISGIKFLSWAQKITSHTIVKIFILLNIQVFIWIKLKNQCLSKKNKSIFSFSFLKMYQYKYILKFYLSLTCVILSTGVGIPSMLRGGNSCRPDVSG